MVIALQEWISNQRVAYHEHDGFIEHPVAVRYHEQYFSGKTDKRTQGAEDKIDDEKHFEGQQVHSPFKGTISGFKGVDEAKIRASFRGIPENHLEGLTIQGIDKLPNTIFGDAVAEHRFGSILIRRDAISSYSEQGFSSLLKHEAGHYVSLQVQRGRINVVGGKRALYSVAQEFAGMSAYGRMRGREEEIWADVYAARIQGFIKRTSSESAKVFKALGI